VDVRVGVTIFDSFRDIRAQTYDLYKFVGVKVTVVNFFLDLSIGFHENNTFQLKFLF